MWIIFIIFIFLLSIILTIKSKFNNYKLNIKSLIKNDKSALFMTLGTRLGVGSIVGTLSSIIIGGFSSVIWIIIFSFISTSLIYYEALLGNKYKQKINDKEYIGGPFFILQNGLKSKYLKYISLIVLIILYSFLFQMIQVNSISYIVGKTLKIKKIYIFISMAILLFVTTRLSLNDTKNIMNKVVPIKCILFFSVCIFSIITHFDDLSNSFHLLIEDIFNFKSIFVGLIIGVKRSIFINEILIGTTSVSSATDKNDINLSIKYQLFSVYFVTIINTLLITCLILIYLNKNIITNDYNILISNIFNYIYGYFGNYILIIIFILFGSTALLGGYYIFKSNIDYLFNNKVISYISKILFILIVLSGIFINNDYIWKYIDILIFIMIIINSYSIIKLIRKC